LRGFSSVVELHCVVSIKHLKTLKTLPRMAIFSMKEFTMMAITTADVFDPAHGDDEVWRNWNPTLDNDHLTLGEVYESLPGFPPEAIHPLVCLFENPESRLAFPGVASLRRHDCLHILLGRGLLG
jgi:hypothetical protein